MSGTPVAKPHDDRPPLAVAMEWTSRITTISLEMFIPALAGNWLDERLGTSHVLLIVGMILGFAIGLWSLIKLTQPPGPDRHTDGDPTKSRRNR